MIEINEDLAKRILDIVDVGLSSGLGEPIPGRMCVEAAVCYAMGLPHSDDPGCVDPVVRKLKIALNDSSWSSDDARAKGMRRLAIAQLGTNKGFNSVEFSKKLACYTIRVIVPIALRAASSVHHDNIDAATLLAAATLCEAQPTQKSAYAAYAAARAAYAADAAAAYAARAAYADAAAAYAARAAYAAARAAYAADAAAAYADARAAYAADAADARAAYADAAAYAARAAADSKDSVLSLFAEGVTQILLEMKSLGSAFLYLTD